MSENNKSIRIEVSQKTKDKIKSINEKRKAIGQDKLGYRYFFENGVNEIYDETFSENSDERALREAKEELRAILRQEAKARSKVAKLEEHIENKDLFNFMEDGIKPLLKAYREKHKDSSIEDFVNDKFENIIGIYEGSTFKDDGLDSQMIMDDEEKIEILVRIIKENI